MWPAMARTPTAALAAGSLIGGYAVAVASGSRPLGGVVLVSGGLCCAAIWNRRHGLRTASALTGVGLGAFALSHALGLVIGAWPAVICVSAATACIVWVRSDAPAAPQAEARV
jgi:hypothetical protein